MESKNLYTIAATVRIKKGQGRTLKAGGAWIYDNEIDAITGEFQNGNLVSVEDFDGFFLGQGFINTNSKLTVRMLSRKKGTVIDDAFIEMRVKNAWEYRKATVDTSSCRVIFGEADFLPGIVIDKFSDVLVVESLALGIDRLKPVIVDTLRKVLSEDGITIRGVYERSDAKVRLQEGMERHNFQDPGVDRTGRIYGAMDPLYHPVFFQVYPGTVPFVCKTYGKEYRLLPHPADCPDGSAQHR